MFHNSTTLHRHNPFQAPIAAENRMAYGILDSIKSAGSAVGSRISSAAGASWKFLKIGSWIYMWPPIWWGIKKGWEAAKGFEHVGEAIVTRTRDSVTNTFKAVAKPSWTLIKSPFKDVKINFVDVPKAILWSLFELPFRAAGTPGQMIQGVRESISAIPRGISETFGHIRDFQFLEAMRSTRSAVWDTLTKFITTPAKHILHGPARIAGEIAESKFQYLRAINKSRHELVEHGRAALSAALGWMAGSGGGGGGKEAAASPATH